jgi:hypothetical protein
MKTIRIDDLPWQEKWVLMPGRKVFRMTEVDSYEGEE